MPRANKSMSLIHEFGLSYSIFKIVLSSLIYTHILSRMSNSYTIPSSFNFLISPSDNPNDCDKTSSVCSPNIGGDNL
jgi:hypothetical protein